MKSRKPGKIILPVILGIIVAGGIGYGISQYIFSIHHEYTDDAQVDSDISPVVTRVTGYVDSIYFEDNQPVKQGQVLVKLDDRDLRIKVEQAKAALENALANVAVAKANVAASQAGNDAAVANVENAKVKLWKATQDFNRYQNLLEDKSITQQQYDAAKADKESAAAQLQLAQKQLATGTVQTKVTTEQITVVQSNVTARQADLDYALLQLSYATIKAPASGIASKKTAHPGQLVQAGQTIFTIVSDSNVYVVANFKETQLDQMKAGQHVSLKADAFPDADLEGTVYSFSPATGAKFSLLPPDNATGNFVKVIQRVPVKIKLTSSAEQTLLLRPGMSVRVTVDL